MDLRRWVSWDWLRDEMSQFIKGITWGLVRVRVHNPEVAASSGASQVAGSVGDAAEEARAQSL